MYLIDVQQSLIEELNKSYMEAYAEYCRIPRINFIRRSIAKGIYQSLSQKWWYNMKILGHLLDCEYNKMTKTNDK